MIAIAGFRGALGVEGVGLVTGGELSLSGVVSGDESSVAEPTSFMPEMLALNVHACRKKHIARDSMKIQYR